MDKLTSDLLVKNLIYLREKNRYTQEHVSERLGIKRSIYKHYEYDGTQPDLRILVEVADLYGATVDELLRVDLEALDLIPSDDDFRSLHNQLRVLAITVNERDEENIEFVPVKAKAGYTAGYSNPEFISSLKRFSLPNTNTGTYRAFEIEGDSMLPHMAHGAIVVGRYVESYNQIQNLKTYIIVTKEDGVVYKRVISKLRDKKALVAMSDNPIYDPYYIYQHDILEIWGYHCHLSFSPEKQLPETEIIDRLELLTGEVINLKELIVNKL